MSTELTRIPDELQYDQAEDTVWSYKAKENLGPEARKYITLYNRRYNRRYPQEGLINGITS